MEAKTSEIQEERKETIDSYKANFDPPKYLQDFYGELLDEIAYFLKHIYEAFHKEPVLTNRPKAQRHLLEFGCGPTPVYSGAVAAAFYTDSVTMAELIPANRRALESWMNNDKDAFNFDKQFNYVESLMDEDMKKKHREENVTIAQRLRNAFQLVLPCEAFMENPLSPICQKYDVILSIGCLCAVSTSEEDYKTVVGNVANLLKPGGVLVLGDPFTESYYHVGTHKFPCIKSTVEMIRRSITSLGLKIIKMVDNYDITKEHLYDKGFESEFSAFFLIAQKPL